MLSLLSIAALMAFSLCFSFHCLFALRKERRYDRTLYPICQDRREAYQLLVEKRYELSDADYKAFVHSIRGMDDFIHSYKELVSMRVLNIKTFLESMVKTVRFGNKVTLKVEKAKIKDEEVNSVLKKFSLHFICCFFVHTSIKLYIFLGIMGLISMLHQKLNIGRGQTVKNSTSLTNFRNKYKNYPYNEHCTT